MKRRTFLKSMLCTPFLGLLKKNSKNYPRAYDCYPNAGECDQRLVKRLVAIKYPLPDTFKGINKYLCECEKIIEEEYLKQTGWPVNVKLTLNPSTKVKIVKGELD